MALTKVTPNMTTVPDKLIGEVFALWDNITGTSSPSNSGSRKYIKLTAGLTSAGQYNNGLLNSETISGTFPTNTAVATITSGPLTGQQVHLLNTEGGFLRGSTTAGAYQQDALQNITGTGGPYTIQTDSQTAGAFANGPYLSAIAAGYAGGGNMTFTFDASRVARTSDHTRPKNVSVTYYMRIV